MNKYCKSGAHIFDDEVGYGLHCVKCDKKITWEQIDKQHKKVMQND